MSAPKIIGIPLDQIDAVDRIRDPDPAGVQLLVVSMRERGLISPITVRPTKSGRYRLITGAHRLEAAKVLFAEGAKGWQAITAIIEQCDDDEAELREIDENLHRQELTPYDQAEFLARRWVVWHRKYGSGHGGNRKASSENLELEQASKKTGFFEDTAKKLGVHHDTVRLAVKRRLKTSDDVWARLKGTETGKKGILLDRLQRHPDPARVLDVAEAEFNGDVQAALEKLKSAQPKKTPKPPTPAKMFKAVKAAWAQWPPAQRQQFLADVGGLK